MRRSSTGHEGRGRDRAIVPWLQDRELLLNRGRMGGSYSTRSRSVFQRQDDHQMNEESETMETSSSSYDENAVENFGDEDLLTDREESEEEESASLGRKQMPFSPSRDPQTPVDPHQQHKRINDKVNGDLFPCNKTLSFPKYFLQREQHGNQVIKTSDSRRMASHLIPNRVERAATLETKCFCGTFDPSGNLFVSASQDCLIRVYNTRNGKFKHLKSHKAEDVGWSIIDLDVSPDSQKFIYSSWNESIRLANISGVGHHQALKLGSPDRSLGVFSIRFSPNRVEVIAGCSDNSVRIYDIHKNKQVSKIKGHENEVNSVAFVDNSANIIASGGDDDIIRIWDRRTLSNNASKKSKAVGWFCGHFNGITFIDCRLDGRYLISNSKDQTIKLWDMRNFSPQKGISESKALSLSYDWDYRWQAVPYSHKNNSERMRADTSIMTYKGHLVRQTLIRCRFSPIHSTGQRYIYSGSADGAVYLYDVLTGDVVAQLQSHSQVCRDASWHPYFPDIISSSWDGSISRWTRADEDHVQEEALFNNLLFHPLPSLRRSSRLADQARQLTATLTSVVDFIGSSFDDAEG